MFCRPKHGQFTVCFSRHNGLYGQFDSQTLVHMDKLTVCFVDIAGQLPSVCFVGLSLCGQFTVRFMYIQNHNNLRAARTLR